MQLAYDNNTYITLPPPQWGYKTTIAMNYNVDIAQNGEPKFFDFGNQYDTRTCEADFVLNYDAIMWLDSLLVSSETRNKTYTLTPDSGFYPFGTDYSSNSYEVAIIKYEKANREHRKKSIFFCKLTFLLVSCGTSAPIASGRTQGKLKIGSVAGLPFPKSAPSTKREWPTQNGATLGGKWYSLDSGDGYYTTDLQLELNAYNMAQLLHELTVTARAADLSIESPAGMWLFDDYASLTNGSSDMIVKQINNKLVINHSAYNRFSIELSFLHLLTVISQ